MKKKRSKEMATMEIIYEYLIILVALSQVVKIHNALIERGSIKYL